HRFQRLGLSLGGVSALSLGHVRCDTRESVGAATTADLHDAAALENPAPGSVLRPDPILDVQVGSLAAENALECLPITRLVVGVYERVPLRPVAVAIGGVTEPLPNGRATHGAAARGGPFPTTIRSDVDDVDARGSTPVASTAQPPTGCEDTECCPDGA